MVDTVLSAGNDLFAANWGMADTVNGVGGDDTIIGRDGNDSLIGGDGHDSLDGGEGNDTLLGGDGCDTLSGGAGKDELHGGEGKDWLYAEGGPDSLYGEGGDDTLVSGWGDHGHGHLLNGGEGNDSLAGVGNDTLLGGAGDDTITALYGTNYLEGGSGNDLLIGGNGANVMVGGQGADTFSVPGNNAQPQYIEGGGSGDVTLINADFNPDALSLEHGSVNIAGTDYAYSGSYVTDTGFQLYFRHYDGTLQFNNAVVELEAPCFAEGTMILTPGGERPVEDLRAGDLVVTIGRQGGVIKPVRWVGHRHVDLDTHPRPQAVAPILVMPGALGPCSPQRPLRVSPDHALFVEGVLVPAEALVDGRLITRMPPRGSVTYYHVELEQHDVLIADGALAESYLDMGNRHMFENGALVRALHADFHPREGAAAGAGGCAPRVTEGLALEAVRVALRRACGEVVLPGARAAA